MFDQEKSTKIQEEFDPLALAAITQFPSPVLNSPNPLSNAEKKTLIAQKFREIMEILDLDLTDDSLRKTPERVAKMYVEEIFSGLDTEQFPEISFFEDRFQHSERPNIVVVKVGFTSFCEHHFLPIHGTAHVAYLPHGKLIGLSKIPRIVRYFAKRPQIQERLTAQIADSLATLLTEDVAVSITAKHSCVIARGVEDRESQTTTHVLRGEFDINPSLREDFFKEITRER